MEFINALRQEDSFTLNGMPTNSTSLSSTVDLFFAIGAMRGGDKDHLISLFSKSFSEDPDRAMKILFWARDIRGGAGERQTFRDVCLHLAKYYPLSLKKNLSLIAEYGRWDDVLALVGTQVDKEAMDTLKEAIIAENSLCAKWMPRKGPLAAKLRTHFEMSPKTYRKTLVRLTSVVETKMCSKEWDKIEYGKLPSVASARYQKAFGRNDQEGYSKYIQELKSGDAKINAGAVYPYDVIKSLARGEADVAVAQWNALPNYMEGSTDMVLPLVDVSGSMTVAVGGNQNLTCLDVAVSLGLYISERNEGPFKDTFITFSERPEVLVLSGDLKQRHFQMSSSSWGYNTDLEAVFDLILDQSVKHSVKAEDMPNKILILSDMEFDVANGNLFSKNPSVQEMIEAKYAAAGYKVPGIAYWNLRSRAGNVPVSAHKSGAALVSGFSPAILKSLLSGDFTSPQAIMDKTILSERYAQIIA
jgi:hypothetical protein